MPIDAFRGTISGAGYGYVYVMTYPGAAQVKIGHTLNPTTRVVDIGGTLAPQDPVVELLFWCSERREEVERRAHLIQAAHHHRGEWFTISVGEAGGTLRRAAAELGVEMQLVFDRANHEELQRSEKEARNRRWKLQPLHALMATRDEMRKRAGQDALRGWSQVRSTGGRRQAPGLSKMLDEAYRAAGGDSLDKIIEEKTRIFGSLPKIDEAEMKRAITNRLSDRPSDAGLPKSIGVLLGRLIRRVKRRP